MDIGSAKPTKEEMAIAPHHLINICDPKESYSAADFREDCIRLVDEICKRGHVPIICGGTMMYYKALVDGLSPVPPSTKEVRERVLSEANENGWPYMHSLLKQFDEDAYKRLNPKEKVGTNSNNKLLMIRKTVIRFAICSSFPLQKPLCKYIISGQGLSFNHQPIHRISF